MGILNRNHVAVAGTPSSVKWDANANAFVYSKLVEHGWRDFSIATPFAMDIWSARHGWEWWDDVGGSKIRRTVLASVSDPVPAANDAKAKQIYAVPIYSRELGGGRDMVIKNKNPTDALCDFFEKIEMTAREAQQAHTLVVPVVAVTTCETADFGVAPVFEVDDWDHRPTTWPTAIVRF